MARSHRLPSSRAGLFVIGKYSVPRRLIGENKYLQLVGVGVVVGSSNVTVLAKELSRLTKLER